MRTSTVIILLLLSGAAHAFAGTTPTDTTFTYQARLDDGGEPADGNYNIDVRLWNAEEGGSQIGATQLFNNIAVADGLVTLELDFGASAFDNTDRWLGFTINGTPMGSRQPVTRTPYAIQTRGIRVDSIGRVGIGTNAPTFRLHVVADGGTGILSDVTSAGGFATGVIGKSSSPDGIGVRGEGGIGVNAVGEGKGVQASGGAVGVYGYSDAGTGVEGKCDNKSGFDFNATGAGMNYGATSSRRWKRNIVPIADPLGMLAAMRGVTFVWDAEHGGHHDVGMIAEEVGEVLPEIVNYETNGIDAIGMDYSKLTPLLVEAVKALRAEKDAEIASLRAEKHAEIAELRATNESLADESTELRNRLDRLESLVRQLAIDKKGALP